MSPLGILIVSILLCLLFFVVLHSSRRLARMGPDEESAHAGALQRRKDTAERRREDRHAAQHPATATVLGSEEGIGCQIINVSRSGMRIAVSQALPIGAQVNVAWGSQFFVGSVRYSASRRGGHVVGMQVISTNRG